MSELTVTQSHDIRKYTESIINTVRESLIVLDEDLRVVSGNHSFYENFKVSEAETAGKLIYELGNSQWNIPRLREALETIIPRDGLFDDLKVEHTFTAIGRKVMLLNGRKIDEEGSQRKLILLAIEDVTERMRTENELSAFNLRYRSLLENINSIIISINPVRAIIFSTVSRSARGIRANPAFYRTFKTSQDETENRAIFQLGNGQWNIPLLREALEKVIPENSVLNDFEVSHDFPSIGRRIMRMNVRRVNQGGGREQLILLSIRDITEQRRQEDEVQRYSAMMEERNKELDSFNYSISHDLRAPLRAIDCYSRILETDYADKIGVEGKNSLATIRRNARRMGELISDLLNLSRLTRCEIKKVNVDMSTLARAMFDETFVATPGRKIELDLKELPPAYGDPVMLKQVWANLIGNAVKFTSKREVGSIEVGSQLDGDNDIYYVKDNGAGFDMRYADQLFGIFQRLHTTDEFPGTGVGLAIVRRIISWHGGRVWAGGKVNEGAIIWFTLPKKN